MKIRVHFLSILATWLLTMLTCSALADKVDKPVADPPHGSISGTLFRSDTGEPVGRQWLNLKRRGWSKSGSTDTYGRFDFRHVPAGVYELSFYDSGYKVRTFGPIRVEEGQQVKGIEFKAVPVDAQVAPYTYSDTYLPGQNVAIMVRSIRVSSIEVEVYKFNRKDVVTRRSELLDYKRLTLSSDKRPLLTYRQPVSGGHRLRWQTTRVEPAFDAPGLYVVKVSGAGSAKLIPILVTRLSLVTKRTPKALWVWATDLETGRPLPAVRVQAEARDGKYEAPKTLLRSRKTNRSGLVELPGVSRSTLRIWGAYKGHFAYVDTTASSRADALSFRTYIHTDRPAYRPGDEVHFKVVARENRQGVYRVKPDDEWSVLIRDAEGQVVHESEHRTNLFGSFSGAFTVSSVPALGHWTIEARSGARSQAGRFQVLEYRKPDYKLHLGSSQKVYVQGTTVQVSVHGQYYFGTPLEGREVEWTAYETPFRPWWYDEYWGAVGSGTSVGYGSVAKSGVAVLDSSGRATIELDVEKASIDRWVTIEAVISDDSGRQVNARHKVTVTRGTFRLGVRGHGKIFKVGETAQFDLSAHQFDGTPAAQALKVTASLETFSKRHKIWIYQTLASADVQTDASGRGTYQFRVPQDGFIRLEVSGRDNLGNPVVESTFFWATKDASIAGGYKKKSLDILSDKRRYEPGDMARVLVNTSMSDPWILFTLEGDGVFEPQVLKVDGNSRLVELNLGERHAPNVYMSVAFVGNKQFNSLQRSVAISPRSKILKLDIRSDKEEYPPGSTATYEIQATDQSGAPVQAELALSLIDESLYAVSKDLAPAIGAFFYGHRPNPVRTAHSFPSRYLGGADKDGEESDEGVRRDFKDMAYWNAHVETNAAGKAIVSIPLPDNLTTWRLTARAVTKDTLVGHQIQRIRTNKDLLATVSLPRFARQGDQFDVVTIIHNRGEDLEGLSASLTVNESITILGDSTRILNVPSGASRTLRWPARVSGTATHAKVQFEVEGGSLSDAEERTIPVHPVQVTQRAGVSGSTAISQDSTFVIPETARPDSYELELRLDTSLASSIGWSLESLANYPYGCVEQTLNTFLPDLVAHEAMTELGIKRSGRLAEVPSMVRKGLMRLYEMQQDDGSFGWWTDDSFGDPHMTAYAVYGWSRAASLGYSVTPRRLQRAISAAMGLFEDAVSPDVRAFLTYAIAHTAESPERKDFLQRALPTLRDVSPATDTYTQAVIILAHVAAGNLTPVDEMAARLRSRITRIGELAFFRGTKSEFGWTDNTYETTAYALRALLAANAEDPLVEASARWLLLQRRGGMWDTTKDTAAVVEALIALAQRRNDAESDYRAVVRLNGQELGVVNALADAGKSKALSVPSRLLRTGENVLSIEKHGQGTVYWTGELTYGGAPEAHARGMAIHRQYGRIKQRTPKAGESVSTIEPLDDSPVNIGEEIEVVLTLKSDASRQFVAIEDFIPAGFEVVPGVSPRGFSGMTVRDDRVAFFTRTLSKGTHTLRYRLRAETAGELTSSPAVAWQMYMPSISGNTASHALTVQASD
ncbi:MAG: MG2 domain-containing protein [Myxococcota bacterium]|nr:MG2 domain-containing protein [Myxococcota bacterium]